MMNAVLKKCCNNHILPFKFAICSLLGDSKSVNEFIFELLKTSLYENFQGRQIFVSIQTVINSRTFICKFYVKTTLNNMIANSVFTGETLNYQL